MTTNKEKTTSKKTLTLVISAVATIALISASYAFAVESYPYWYTRQAVPDGSADGGERKAYANADGNNGVYAKSNAAYESRLSMAKNNYQANPYVTDTPTLTTSSSTVGYAADIDYDGNITWGFGSIVYYAGGAELLKKSGSNWVLAHSCHYIVEGGDNYDESRTQKCTYGNSGTKFQSGRIA